MPRSYQYKQEQQDENNMLELTTEIKKWLKNTANRLKGSDRRMFMAETVQQFGKGGASAAERELGWDRHTIRKGQKELEWGAIEDNFTARGRKKSEYHLPTLLDDIKKIVEPESQTDPTFQTQKLYTRLTAKEVRKQLLKLGYDDATLPKQRTISNKLDELGYHLKKVQKVND